MRHPDRSRVEGTQHRSRSFRSRSVERRSRTDQPNALLSTRAALFALLGKDITMIDGLGPTLLKLIAECGDELSSWPSAKLLLPGWAWRRTTRSPAKCSVENAPVRWSRCGTSAACCRNRWSHRHRARRLLQAALGAYRQGQSSHRHGAQGRSPVLQRRTLRNGVRRPRCVGLRDTLPQGVGTICIGQGIRICSSAHGAELVLSFLRNRRRLSHPPIPPHRKASPARAAGAPRPRSRRQARWRGRLRRQ